MLKKINPVILVGGTGTRLWPLSRANHPKQFVSIQGEYSLFQQTVQRVKQLENLHRIYLVVSESTYFLCLDQLHDLKLNNIEIIVEPEGRNTAAAIAAAACVMQEKSEGDELMLVLPSDHKISDHKKFAVSVNQATDFYNNQELILFGIKPTEPSVAYGYIQAENQALTPSKVKSFFEKPTEKNARILIAQPHCYWNGGLFLFSANAIGAELKKHAPDIYTLAFDAVKNGITRDNTLYLSREYFSQVPNLPIDIAVMEKTSAAYMIELNSDWSDLGDWNAIHKNTSANEEGNVAIGNVISLNTHNSYLHTDSKLLATVGVKNLIVVASKDSVLIADKSQSQDVKTLVNLLKTKGYADYLENDLKVHRPWGTYESVMKTKHFQVKHIVVKPGGKLSLQSHEHRSEHWVIVSGIADVTCGEKTFQIHPNESTYIPKKTKHRLMNHQTLPLELVEVQVGNYVGEDDIVRYDDVYGRKMQYAN